MLCSHLTMDGYHVEDAKKFSFWSLDATFIVFFFLLCFSLTLEDCGCCSKITKEPSRDKKETAGGVTLACWDASSLSFAYEFSSRHANRNG